MQTETAEYNRVNDMLTTAMDIGQQMLMTGADVTRVEDSVSRICRRFDVDDVQVFCLASLLQASVRMRDGRYCIQMRRIFTSDNNLARLEELNSISRSICSGGLTIEEARGRLEKAKVLECYRPLWYYVAAIFGASSFSLFFGGSLADGLCAAVASVPVLFCQRHPFRKCNQMVNTIFQSFVGGLTVNVVMKLGLGQNIDLICIGVIMLLISGMMFGNAMQDFMRSDVLAGGSKLVHALLLAMLIVLGFGISMFCFGNWAL